MPHRRFSPRPTVPSPDQLASLIARERRQAHERAEKVFTAAARPAGLDMGAVHEGMADELTEQIAAMRATYRALNAGGQAFLDQAEAAIMEAFQSRLGAPLDGASLHAGRA